MNRPLLRPLCIGLVLALAAGLAEAGVHVSRYQARMEACAAAAVRVATHTPFSGWTLGDLAAFPFDARSPVAYCNLLAEADAPPGAYRRGPVRDHGDVVAEGRIPVQSGMARAVLGEVSRSLRTGDRERAAGLLEPYAGFRPIVRPER